MDEERKDNSFRILVPTEFKNRVQAMYDELGKDTPGFNLSSDTRDFWEQKLKLYEESKRGQ